MASFQKGKLSYLNYSLIEFIIYLGAIHNTIMFQFSVLFSMMGPMLSMVPIVSVKISVVINPILYIGYNSHVIIKGILHTLFLKVPLY